jgi:hypothetical protein
VNERIAAKNSPNIMKQRPLLLFLVAFFWGINTQGQQRKSTEQLSGLLDRYASAINERDAEKAASLFLDDDFFRYVSAGFVVTTADWKKYQTQSWDRMSSYSFAWRRKQIRPMGMNFAVATCFSNSTFKIKGGPMGLKESIFTITFEKVNERWFISSIHQSPNHIENAISE